MGTFTVQPYINEPSVVQRVSYFNILIPFALTVDE